MVFFKSFLEAGKIAVILGLLFVVLNSFGIRLFAGTINSLPGLVLFFMLLVFFVMWVKF